MKSTWFVLLLFFSFAAKAQNSVASFIKTAAQDPDVVKLTKQIEFLTLKQYKLSPIQKLEFRTESNQLDPTRQEYALRINPANPWEMHAQNRFFDQLNKQYELEREIILEKQVAERYLLIVDYAATQQLHSLHQQEQILIRQLVATLEKQTQSDYFDADKYFDLILKEIEITETLEETTLALKKIEKSFVEQKDIIPTLATETFIYIPQIDSVLHESLAPPSRLLLLSELKQKSNTASIRLEKNNINIGYVQAQYQEFRIEQGRRPWNIGLGITIPLFNPNKQNITKRSLTRIEDKYEADRDVQEQKLKAARLFESLTSLIEREKKIQVRKQELQNTKIQNLLLTYGDNNPAVSLKLKLQLTKLDILDLKLKQKIWTDYILWLETTNRLWQNPYQNMLSAKYEPIEF
ncbi:MAG: hypothetical protein ACK5WV_02565 [Chryseotalea sp.]